MNFLKLKYKADRITVLTVLLYFIGTGLTWYWFDHINLVAKIGAVALLCVLSFMCAIIVHNTIHVPIFGHKSSNKIFQIILSMTYGHSVSAFVIGHNLSHHQHTGEAQDIARTDKLRFRWNFLNQLFFFFVTSNGIMKSEILWVKKMWQEGREKWVLQYALELSIVTTIKIALLVFNWKVTLITIWLPHLWAQWGIVGTNYWQHDGCDTSHPYNHSRNFTNRVLNFISFNNGFHGLHHNQPTLHWSLLPDVYESEFKQHLHPNLNQNSLLKYLWSACGWPGKRLDYLGKHISPSETITKDSLEWVNKKRYNGNEEHIGAEA